MSLIPALGISAQVLPWLMEKTAIKDELVSNNSCNIYIGAEPSFSAQTKQVIDCFERSKVASQENDPAAATHYFLFITDSLLKSKKDILPLIRRLIADPHFKQRLFPVIMDKKVSIFGPGEELKYVQYWSDALKNAAPSEQDDIKLIEENISLMIRMIRDTLMPPLDQLLQDNLSSITQAIEKRSHLLETKRFFFLPQVKASTARTDALAQLSSLFAERPVVSITGAAGAGKTTLAIEYAKASEIYTSGIFWLDATNKQTLEESFKQLATQLEMSSEQVKKEFPHMKDVLLIYDNVTDPFLVLPSAHTLIIGQNLSYTHMTIGSFTSEEAHHYLVEQLGISSEAAKLLSDLLANHPAKLAEAVAYIKSSKISAKMYVDFYLSDRERLVTKQKALENTKTSLAPAPTLLSNLDPSPQTLEKYLKFSLEQLQNEIKEQAIQIFISYNWSATPQVNQIDTLFKEMGIELLRDTRKMREFESVREFMKKVILESDYTFSVVTPIYLKSFNCLFEIITTMRERSWTYRLFPIVMPGTDLSDEAIFAYQEHWTKQANQLTKVGGSPTEIAIAKEGAEKIVPFLQTIREMQSDSFDIQLKSGFQNTLAIMLARQERLEKKGIYKETIFHLPMGRNRNFTGREKELAHLEESLKSGHSGAITNTGMGGVGKSQLALEFAYRNAEKYKMIYWIRSEQTETIKADLRMLGLEMGISEEFLKDDVVISTMKNALEKQKGWLLIFDNAEDPNMLREVLPQGGHVIITSRNPNWDKPITIDVFSKEEALHYLQKISGISGQEEELNLLSEELGFLPLALTQAGAYIRRQQIDVATYRTAFKEGQKQMLSQKEKGYPGSVATAWLLSMEKIANEDPNALKLLNFCSCLAPDRIPEEFLETWLKYKHRTNGLGFQDALRILESYSLIVQEVEQKEGSQKKWISIHRLIQTVTLDQCELKEAKQAIIYGVMILQRKMEGKVGTQEERKAEEVLIPHARALIGHAEERNALSAKEGDVSHLIGAFLHKTSDFKGAKQYYENAIKIYNTSVGVPPTVVAQCYNNLALALRELGNLIEATEYLDKALKMKVDFLGSENNIEVAQNYINMGTVKQNKGDLDGAKENYETAIRFFTANPKTENHIDLAGCYNNLGVLHKDQGDFDQAKEYYEKALDMKIACLKTKNHMSVASSYNNLGTLEEAQGNLTKALEYHEKALKIKVSCFETENHTSVAASYHNIRDCALRPRETG